MLDPLTFALLYPNPASRYRYYPPLADLDWATVTLCAERRGRPRDFALTWYPGPAASAPVALLVHGRSKRGRYLAPLISRLQPHYGVATIDLWGHGDDRYGCVTHGYEESAQIAAAMDWLAMRGATAVYLYGVSMGGATVLAYLAGCAGTPAAIVCGAVIDGTFDEATTVLAASAKRMRLPDTLVQRTLQAANTHLGFDLAQESPRVWAGRVPLPCRVIHGDRDWLVPVSCAERLGAALGPNCDGVAIYAGGHDEPDNTEMQDLVLQALVSRLGPFTQ